MKSETTLRVVVSRQRVPVKVFETSEPVFHPSGVILGNRKVRRVIYGESFDYPDQRLIDDAQRISDSLGLRLEVIDGSKLNIFRRVLASVSERIQGSAKVLSGSGGASAGSSPDTAQP